MRDTTRYEIFKDDPPRSPRWLEAVEGLEQAMNRLEELATNDPSSDYYLYSNQADRLIRHLRRTSPFNSVSRGYRRALPETRS
jgi:hypothetical protein